MASRWESNSSFSASTIDDAVVNNATGAGEEEPLISDGRRQYNSISSNSRKVNRKSII
jgi:hypothetical protein